MTWLARLTYARYLAASVGALGVDVATFLAALPLMPATLAAAFGYSAGIAAHWLLSTRMVFAGRLAQQGGERAQQFLFFIVSALAGLAVTMAIVGGGDAAGLDARLAKVAAIGVSFQLTYWLRSRWVFA